MRRHDAPALAVWLRHFWPQVSRVALAVVGLGMAAWFLSAQAASPTRAFPWAALLLIVTVIAIESNPQWRGILLHFGVGRAAALAIAGGLGAWLLREYPARPAAASHTDLVVAWLLSLVFYGLAVTPLARPRGRARRLRHRLGRHRWLAVLLGGIVLGALVLRLAQLGTIPYVLSGDEALFGLEARAIIDGAIRDPFALGALSQPMLGWYWGGLGMRWLGPDVAALRLPWALLGAGTVLVAYWLVSLLHGTRLALITSALLATYHFHIHYSRLALNNVADPLLVGLALIGLQRALRGGRAADWFGTGVVCGLALYFYTGARFVPLLIGVLLIYRLARERRRSLVRNGGGMLIALGAFALAAAPLLQNAVRSPADYFARDNTVGIFQSGWLDNAARIRGEAPLLVLADHARYALLAFNLYPDRSLFYALPQPLLDPVSGILLLFGLGYASVRALGRGPHRRFMPMVAWWWGGMILGGVLTIDEPASQRLITLAVPTCFFIALALQHFAALLRAALPRLPINAVLTATVLVFGIASVKLYFADYTPLRLYGGERAQIATATAPLIASLGPGYTTYFGGAPAMFWGLATFEFLAPHAEGQDLLEPLTAATVPVAAPERGMLFIFTAERREELAFVRSAYPDGVMGTVHNQQDGRFLAVTYIIAAPR